MSTKREIKSFWWAPENPETRWFGTLTLETEHSPQLELVVERRNLADDIRPLGRVIHGIDEHGKPITLLFSAPSGHSISGAILTRRIVAGYALLGIALPDAASFVANKLRFQIQHLYGWFGISGFDRSQQQSFKEYVIRYQQPNDRLFPIGPDFELRLHSSVEECGGGFQEHGIREDAAASFRSKAGFSLDRCFELVRAVQELLHFASLKRVYPVCITAYKEGHGRRMGNRWIGQDIEVWGSFLREAESEPPISEWWIFRFEDVNRDFAGFMRDWLAYTEKFSEALGCYCSTIYHRLTDALEHLSLTQALEAYHGTRFSSHHKHEFQAKIEELGNLHAASLRGLVDDVGDFAERVLCTRNHYTHHNPKWVATGKVAERGELFRMNEKLKLLFQMCVLTDLGIPADRFNRLRRQLATEIMDYV
jgi:uncharacterized protein YqgV (UPF0045/DUF77 family)